jgi:hypothetical protein
MEREARHVQRTEFVKPARSDPDLGKAKAIAQAVAGSLKGDNRIISVASRGRPAFTTGHIAQGQ